MNSRAKKNRAQTRSGQAVFRPRDLARRGVPRQDLYRLCREGRMTRLARGLYAPKDYRPTEHQGLMVTCSRIPKGVVCLLSALQFHDLTTQMPHEVWVAVRRPARPLSVDLPVRIFYFSQAPFDAGIETHQIQGVSVRVYCPAKTVADCFKFRNKIGLDVALEALRDSLAQHKCSVDEIWKYAKMCRVANVMRPYLEASV